MARVCTFTHIAWRYRTCRREVSKLVKGVRIFLTVQFKVHAKYLTPPDVRRVWLKVIWQLYEHRCWRVYYVACIRPMWNFPQWIIMRCTLYLHRRHLTPEAFDPPAESVYGKFLWSSSADGILIFRLTTSLALHTSGTLESRAPALALCLVWTLWSLKLRVGFDTAFSNSGTFCDL